MSENETELIKKAQNGDKSAFNVLLQEYYDVMFKMAYKWCGNRETAEDITQEACIKLARSINSFKFNAKFTSWLYRLVINTGIDWQRKHSKETSLADSGHVGVSSENAEKSLHAREILQQVLTLPEKEKTALLLVFSEGMTHKEAADIMDCKESTVSWYIMEARKKLEEFEKKERKHG